MKNVIFMCGIPASGKSTYVNNYRDCKDVAVISRDDIRRSGIRYISELEVTDLFYKALENALTDDNINRIFIDNTNVKQRYIKDIIKYCNNICECEYFIKIFNTNYVTCLYRNSLRSNIEFVPLEVMERMRNNFDNFISQLDKFVADNKIKIIED